MLLDDITMGEAFRQLRVGQKLYGLVGMFIVFLICIFLFTTGQIQAQREDFGVIDLVGRQRMLNQRYLKEVLLKGQGAKSQPETVREQMQSHNKALLAGGKVELGKGQILSLEEAPSEMLEQGLKEQQRLETALFSAAEAWLAKPAGSAGRATALESLLAASARVQEASDKLVADWRGFSQDKIQSAILIETFLLVLAIALGLAISHLLLNSILLPIRKLHAASNALMAKDLTYLIEAPGQDELGSASNSLNQAFGQLRGTLQTLLNHSEVISNASEELSTVSHQLDNDAMQSSSTVAQLSAATQEININAEGIATAMEEMHTSINEIAKVSSDALNMGNQGANLVSETVRIVAHLEKSSQQIGQIVTLIESIAEQTNLLALNATIEAARAGEMGKGFAVVANEVKELAQGTRDATQHVTREIKDIQNVTGEVTRAIEEINSIIRSLIDIQAMIAASTEEQSVTTREMAQHIQVAARGNQEIVAGIATVVQTSRHTANGASSVKGSAQQLARMATELEGMVQSFSI